MNYLQVWVYDKPNDLVLKCMKDTLKKLKKTDKYYLIANKKYLRSKKVNYIDCLDYLNSINDKNIVSFYNTLDIQKHCWQISDIIRFHWLSENSDTLYLDCDVKLKSVPKFEKHFYFTEYNKKLADYSLIYNDVDLNFSDKILNESINIYKDQIEKMKKSWIYRIINKRKYREYYKKISDEFFVHYNISKGK